MSGSNDSSVIPLLMPDFGNSMEEGTIEAWNVKEGDAIAVGDVLCQVETDKAVLDYESPHQGRLARILVQTGESVEVQQPIAYLAGTDEELDAFLASANSTPASGLKETRTARSGNDAKPAILPPSVSPGPKIAPTRVSASPAARMFAAERGIDVSDIGVGTGPRERIVSSDVLKISSFDSTYAGDASAPVAANSAPMSRIWSAHPSGLQESRPTVPHYYLRLTVDAERLMKVHSDNKTSTDCTVNDLIVLACAHALVSHPALRKGVEVDHTLELPGSNIGIAVPTDRGLVVPVIMDVERLTLKQIADESQRLITNSQSGKLENVGQGVLTVSNFGMYGIDEFTAIINPPETAILAVGAVREDVIVKDRSIRPGQVITLTLSADHRVADGMVAAQFLASLRELLEEPTLFVS